MLGAAGSPRRADGNARVGGGVPNVLPGDRHPVLWVVHQGGIRGVVTLVVV